MLESNQLHGPLHDFYHVSLALLLNMKFSHRSYQTVIHSLRLYNKYFQDSLNKDAWEVKVCSWNLFQHTHVTKNFSQMDIQNNNDIKQRKIRHPGKLNLEGLSFLFFSFYFCTITAHLPLNFPPYHSIISLTQVCRVYGQAKTIKIKNLVVCNKKEDIFFSIYSCRGWK